MARLLALLLAALQPAAAFLGEAQAPAPSPTVEADLAAGVRQVQEGDFEGAVTTLEGVVRRLESQPGRARDRAQAHLYLGLAHVALDQRDAAKAAFRAALADNKELRLSPEQFSPKVLSAFEEARQEDERAASSAGAPAGKSGTPTLLWVGLGAAATAGAAAVVAGGSDAVQVSNARFVTPVILCPNGSDDAKLSFSVLVDVANHTSRLLTLESVSTIVVIVESDFREERGFSANPPSTWAPQTVSARSRATVLVDAYLLCGNGPGDPARSNHWIARLSLTTSAGVFNLETADRMRVDIP